MPRAIIVCGSPGAGKTTYGKKLAQETGAVFLDIDTATERLVRLALQESGCDPDDRDSPDFKRIYRQPIYKQLFDIARDNLPFNRVVIAGPFTREIRDAQWPQKLSERLGAPVEIHYVFCAPDVRRRRLLDRANARDGAKLKDWDSYIRYYGKEEPPCFEHVFVKGNE
jgi:predicted kinase